MKKLFLVIGLSFGFAHLSMAQGIPVEPGTPTYTVPDYNIQIMAQELDSSVGAAFYLLEKHNDGGWYGFWWSQYIYPDTDLKGQIDLAGGAVTWINLHVLSDARKALANRFPPIGGNTPPAPTGVAGIDEVNMALFQSFAFSRNPDGTVTFGLK